MGSKKEYTVDVSELEAPYPLIEGTKAIQALKEGEVLIFKHRMFPCKLPKVIEENHCAFEVLKESENEFEMRIIKRKHACMD
jgi:TusA-related sulfurtransferase